MFRRHAMLTVQKKNILRLEQKTNTRRNDLRKEFNRNVLHAGGESATTVTLKKSSKPNKKFSVTVGKKTIHFGQRGAEDFTIHKDAVRMVSYVRRHSYCKKGSPQCKWFDAVVSKGNIVSTMRSNAHAKKSLRESWGKDGIATPGFWSRWLLWSHPTLEGAKRFIRNTFNVRFS